MKAPALIASLVLGLGSSASTQAGEVCEVPIASGPVALIIVSSGTKAHAYARKLKGTVVRQDAKTVIFDDGRVITADVESAGRHLNDMGWGSRRIDVVASFSGRRARPRRGRG